MSPAAQRVDRQRMIRVEWYKNMMNEKIWNVCKERRNCYKRKSKAYMLSPFITNWVLLIRIQNS